MWGLPFQPVNSVLCYTFLRLFLTQQYHGLVVVIELRFDLVDMLNVFFPRRV